MDLLLKNCFPDPDHITYFKINPGLYIKTNKTGAQTVPPVDTNENKPCQKKKREKKNKKKKHARLELGSGVLF